MRVHTTKGGSWNQTCEDHGGAFLVAHEAREVLGAAPAREKAKHDLRQAELGLLGGGGDAVVALECPLESATEAGAWWKRRNWIVMKRTEFHSAHR